MLIVRLNARQSTFDHRFSCQEMLGLVFGFWVSQIVRTAAALSVADRLAVGPMTAQEIATAEGSDPEATFRLLCACTALKLVMYEPASGRFAGAAILDTLRRDSPHSLRNLALVQTSPGHWQSWGRFTTSVRAGATQFEAALGCRDVGAYFEQNPEEGQLFGAAMTDLSAPVIREAATVIDTTGVERVADIGGANGAFVCELLARNEKLRGIVFDLPTTLPGAQADAERLGLQDRSMTLARAVIVEMLLGEFDDPGIGTLMDMIMIAMLHGKERDLAEFDTLLKAAGRQRTGPTHLQPPYCVIEAVAG